MGQIMATLKFHSRTSNFLQDPQMIQNTNIYLHQCLHLHPSYRCPPNNPILLRHEPLRRTIATFPIVQSALITGIVLTEAISSLPSSTEKASEKVHYLTHWSKHPPAEDLVGRKTGIRVPPGVRVWGGLGC